jgi:hypothetical protein
MLTYHIIPHSLFLAMEYKTFSIRIPADLCDSLEVEAFNKRRNRNQMIVDIFAERYHAHAPPLRIRPSKSRNGKQAGRKTKAEVN